MPKGRKRAWVSQYAKQVEKLGADKASWYVFWNDPDGKRHCESCGPGASGKKLANRKADQLHAELITGTYESKKREKWADFIAEFERLILAKIESARTHIEMRNVIKHFERIVKPCRMAAIDDKRVQEYVTARQSEGGGKKRAGQPVEGEPIRREQVSPATINKELRTLKGILRKAVRWGYLPRMPQIDFLREPKRLPRYVTPEHFTAIYAACDAATLPSGQGFAAADWWRALLAMAYMTGWRINEILQVERIDVDLAAGAAITRAADNKGRRDESSPLHPWVIDHLRKVASFDRLLFPHDNNLRTLYTQFAAIQRAAGINLPCRGEHVHTPFCHVYGFHDLRRAFATQNAGALTPLQLQSLMRHKAFATTQRYINMAPQMESVVDRLSVPTVGIAKGGSGVG